MTKLKKHKKNYILIMMGNNKIKNKNEDLLTRIKELEELIN